MINLEKLPERFKEPLEELLYCTKPDNAIFQYYDSWWAFKPSVPQHIQDEVITLIRKKLDNK